MPFLRPTWIPPLPAAIRLTALLALTLLIQPALRVAAEAPAGGQPLVRDALSRYILYSGMAEFATSEVVAAPGAPDGKALRFRVRQVPADAWKAQVKWVNDRPVKKGDVLFFSLLARAVDIVTETGECRLTTGVNRGVPPFTNWGEYEFSVAGDWIRLTHPYKVTEDLPAGEIQFAVNLGYARQSLEIADVQLLNYGGAIDIETLPRPVVTYAGREADAPWRQAAEARIGQIRKADLKVFVTDRAGQPVKGVRTSLELTRHAFGFGTSVRAFRLLETSADNQRYRDTLLAHFNRVTFENEMKWQHWDDPDPVKQTRHRADVDRAVEWLRARRLDIRGHCLVWPAWRFLPGDLRPLLDQPEALRTRIRDHVTAEAAHFSGKLLDWDVVNEPVNNFAPELRAALGRPELVEWFRAARRGDPEAKLHLNDYTLLSGGARDPRRIEAFYDNVKFLLENGAPLDGIGEQAHFDSTLVAPADMLALLDRFAAFGLPIQITEFDVATGDAALRADYTRDFYTAAFSHPAITGITMWGFWAGNHWKPGAALWDRNWNLTPNGRVFVDLVKHRWHTAVAGETGPDGTFATRGFLGDYRITVDSAEGRPARTVTATLSPGGTVVRVELD